MLYAKVVLGLPIDNEFDYFVPEKLSEKIKVGIRVEVDFNQQRKIAYVVGLSLKSKIKNPKPIIRLIDKEPVLDGDLLLLTKRVSEYYICSWGQAVESAIPLRLPSVSKANTKKEPLFLNKFSLQIVQSINLKERMDFYLGEIRRTLKNNLSVIFILPEFNLLLELSQEIEKNLNLEPIILSRKTTQDIKNWHRLFSLKSPVLAMGLRSAVFAPLDNLGLIILEDEANPAYKNSQVPYYHVREVSIMRAKIQGLKLIFGAYSLDLESFYLVKKKKAKYLLLSKNKDYPEIKIVSPYRESFLNKKSLSLFIQDQIAQNIRQKGRVLLLLNRRGFANFIFCQTCRYILKCPRCNVNLVYHMEDKSLRCHYCNFRRDFLSMCPVCNSGYIKYRGKGTEKIENQLFNIYPEAKIERYDKEKKQLKEDFDICIATKAILDKINLSFSLGIILGWERFINQNDFRAEENALYLLTRLVSLIRKKIIIESAFAKETYFTALKKRDFSIFYKKELKKRKEAAFPPFRQLILIKLRGKRQAKVLEKTKELFDKLSAYNRNKDIEIFSYGKAQPEKLRDNYYAQVLIKTKNVFVASKFIKKCLKRFSHSGIILTVDVDPIF